MGKRDVRTVERALHESQERIHAILCTVADAIVSIDDAGIVDSFNPAAERLFGYAADEVIGRNVSLLMPEDVAERHDGYLRAYQRTGKSRVIGVGREVEGRRKDGRRFPLELSVTQGKDGERPFYVGVLRDLTARKQSEYALRTAERLAAIGTLAAGLGHDMNNVLLPVRAHLAALEAAGRGGHLRPADRRHARSISGSVAYLQQLADGLHFLAMDPETEPAVVRTDLHSWWRQSGALLSGAVPKSIAFSADVPSALPPVCVAVHRLTQAVLNLLVNASEATTASERKGRVTLTARATRDPALGACVTLCVSDNGKGMSQEVQNRAFDMFFTTKPRGLGTGLGLPLVRRIVAGAGGEVRIESGPGRGCAVSLVLPCKAEGNGALRTAAVSVSDGRVRAMIGEVAEAEGLKITDNPRKANRLWVLEPDPGLLAGARAWLARRGGRRVVLFGAPSAAGAAGWARLNPVIVHDREHLDEVRAAVSQASSD